MWTARHLIFTFQWKTSTLLSKHSPSTVRMIYLQNIIIFKWRWNCQLSFLFTYQIQVIVSMKNHRDNIIYKNTANTPNVRYYQNMFYYQLLVVYLFITRVFIKYFRSIGTTFDTTTIFNTSMTLLCRYIAFVLHFFNLGSVMLCVRKLCEI